MEVAGLGGSLSDFLSEGCAALAHYGIMGSLFTGYLLENHICSAVKFCLRNSQNEFGYV